jgi:hypothetical protein
LHDKQLEAEITRVQDTHGDDRDVAIGHGINPPVVDHTARHVADTTNAGMEHVPAAETVAIYTERPDHDESDNEHGTNRTSNHIDRDLQFPLRNLLTTNKWSEHYRFPALAECDGLREKADALPDMIVVPFEDAMADTRLMGWEDIWVSQARYMGPRLAEPKIDFVYNCQYLIRAWRDNV